MMSKMAIIVMIVAGINPFALLGMETPGAWTWLATNKLYGCLMTFFVSNMIEGQLISTGAFEMSLNGKGC